MNSLRPDTFSGYRSVPVSAGQTSASSASPPGQIHPSELLQGHLSDSTVAALNEADKNTDLSHRVIASMVRNSIMDRFLTLSPEGHPSDSGNTEASYTHQTRFPNGADIELTVRAKRDEQSRYHILSVSLQGAGYSDFISLSAPDPVAAETHQPMANTFGFDNAVQNRFGNISGSVSPTQNHFLSTSGYDSPARNRYKMVPSMEHQVEHPFQPGQMVTRREAKNLKMQRHRAALVPDPDNPGQMTKRGKLYTKNRSDSQRVPDPKNHGQTVVKRTLKEREAMVEHPFQPGQIISGRQAKNLKMQRYRAARVPDPDNPGQMTTKGKLLEKNSTQAKRVPDPKNEAKTVTIGALQRRERRNRKNDLS